MPESTSLSPGDPLSPRQKEILDDLLGQRDKADRPTFRADLADDLHAHIERGLSSERPEGTAEAHLSVAKYDVTSVLDCEDRWFATRGFDGWTVEMLVGTVVHRAIEHYFVNNVHQTPLDLIEYVLEWMAEGDKPRGVQPFLEGIDLADRADLVNAANNAFCSFLDHWPPVDKKWMPRFEQWSNYDELFGGALELRAKHDMAFGRPTGTTGRTVIVDVKTGRPSASHASEARFYALVETLRSRVPPFKVASYYTRSGAVHQQVPAEEMLFQTADSLILAVQHMWQILSEDVQPSRSPGGLCEHYCPRFDVCDEGRQFVAVRNDR